MKYLFSLFLILTISPKGQCCLNEYRTLLDGEVVFNSPENVVPQARFKLYDKADLLNKLNRAYAMYQSSHDITYYSDYAVMLAFNGRFREANTIFLKIEKKTPNFYATAANLGTTYELLGQLDSAIYWLTKAIKINPNSHKGSEWIHLKILEAKKAANGDEQKLWNSDILGLGLGENLLPKNTENRNLSEISSQIHSQLSERMSFIPPKDPVIARLLFDLGNIYALTTDVESALEVYEKAKAYGYNSDVFNQREKHFKNLQFKANFRNNTELWAKRHVGTVLFAAGIVILVALIGVLRKLKRTK